MTATIGYVGLNHHHCEPYLASIELLPAEVIGVCEPDGSVGPGDVGLDPATPTYDTPASLIGGEAPDILWITLSNRETPAVIRTAAEHGVDVYTEKPAGMTTDDLDPLIEDVATASSTVGVSYAWRGHPISREIRDRCSAGFLGPVQSFSARFVASALAFRDTDHYLFDPNQSRGGILQWLGIHWIDLVPWLLDDPIASVSARMRHSTTSVKVEDAAALTLETESGAIGTLLTGYHLREGQYDTQVDLFGRDGNVEWDPMGREFGFEGETEVVLDRVAGDWTTPHRRIVHEYEATSGYGGGWGLAFMEEFLEARSAGVAPPATLEDTRQVLAVLDAAYEAADRGSWVDVE